MAERKKLVTDRPTDGQTDGRTDGQALFVATETVSLDCWLGLRETVQSDINEATVLQYIAKWKGLRLLKEVRHRRV